MGTTVIEAPAGGRGEQRELREPALVTDSQTRPIPQQESGFLGLAAPAYILCFALLGAMVWAAGIWDFIAYTRLLAVFLAGGIVALGEDDSGLGTGVPGVQYFITSQEPVIWGLVLLSAALFAGVALLKGLQFHRIASALGVEGSFSQHFRAYLYGHGIGRMTPYRMGEVAWASALQAQGTATLEQASRLIFIFKAFLLFEIATFAVIGFAMTGLLGWAMALVPPFVIMLGAWLLTRPPAEERAATMGFWERFRDASTNWPRDPQIVIGLMLLSLLSFSMIEFATYIVPQAFLTLHVPLVQDVLNEVTVTTPVIIMAVVAGYIARLVPLTPGGIGQFELAFAMVLMVNNLPLTEAITLAFLVSFVRYTTGVIVFGGMMLFFGIETDFNRVRALFSRADTAAQE